MRVESSEWRVSEASERCVCVSCSCVRRNAHLRMHRVYATHTNGPLIHTPPPEPYPPLPHLWSATTNLSPDTSLHPAHLIVGCELRFQPLRLPHALPHRSLRGVVRLRNEPQNTECKLLLNANIAWRPPLTHTQATTTTTTNTTTKTTTTTTTTSTTRTPLSP